jgi:hypothetical protein
MFFETGVLHDIDTQLNPMVPLFVDGSTDRIALQG